MVGKGIIRMSLREVRRLKVVHEIRKGHITQKVAASMLALSERQVRRLVRVAKKEGDPGVVHKNRGRRSNRKTPDKVRSKVVSLYRRRYKGFGPTLAKEKLLEMDGLDVSKETLRQWLIADGLWVKKRKSSRHRRWRERKACSGEMVQMDGSVHDWLEGRGPKLVFMGYIDDATSKMYGKFYDYEGTVPAMDSFKGYIKKYGLPMSLYLDRHSTYKSKKKLTVEEELAGLEEPMSQFERALKELGVEVIHAYSPQAKGRIERLFGTLQDRLVKEMRLGSVKSKDEANEFLKGYLPVYNKKFQVEAATKTNVHLKLPRGFDLDEYLCVKNERTIRNDNTIAYKGKLYQVEGIVRTKKVSVEERVNGSLLIRSRRGSLHYKEITGRPERNCQPPVKIPLVRKNNIPSKDHPWRRGFKRHRHPLRDACAINQ
jgi:hypothetical protein